MLFNSLILLKVWLDTTLCDKVCPWLATGRLRSPCTPDSSTNKTARHDINEIFLKVELSTITLFKLCHYTHPYLHCVGMQLIHPSVRVQTVGVTVGSGCVKEAVGVKVKSDVTHSYGLLNPYGSGLHIVSSIQLCPMHLPRRTLKKQKIRRQ